MSCATLPPAKIIESARQRLAKATSAEGIKFEAYTAIGMVETLLDLGLIDRNTWRSTRAEFDRIEGDRRKLLEGSSQ